MNDMFDANNNLLIAGYFGEAGSYLIEIIFGLFIFLVLIRYLLQIARADFYNPIAQTVVKLTSPLLIPFRKIIPGLGKLDLATLVLLFLLFFGKLLLIMLVSGRVELLGINFPEYLHSADLSTSPGLVIAKLAIVAILKLINMAIWIYLIAIIILVISSWIASGNYNPFLNTIYQLSNPIMNPIRRRMPNTHGIDFSPLVVMVIFTLIQMALPHLQHGFFILIS